MKLIRMLGCLVVIALALLAGAVFHTEIMEQIDKWRGKPGAAFVPASPERVHVDPISALTSLGRSNGPSYVDLTAADIATLIQSSLNKARAHSFDSVQVALMNNNEIRVRGSLDLHDVPRGSLGPFGSVLGSREMATIGGPLSVDSTGQLQMAVTYLKVGDFPLPSATIPKLLAAAHIPGAHGSTVPLPLPQRIGDVRVNPTSVRFYRRGGR